MPGPARIHASASARVAAAQRRAVERGGRRLNIMLSPQAASDLAEIRERDGDASDIAVIERLLAAARCQATVP